MIPRVDGILAVTRAIGDQSLKRYVISKPDIKLVKIDQKNDLCISIVSLYYFSYSE